MVNKALHALPSQTDREIVAKLSLLKSATGAKLTESMVASSQQRIVNLLGQDSFDMDYFGAKQFRKDLALIEGAQLQASLGHLKGVGEQLVDRICEEIEAMDETNFDNRLATATVLDESFAAIYAKLEGANSLHAIDASVVHQLLARGADILRHGWAWKSASESAIAKQHFSLLNKAYIEWHLQAKLVSLTAPSPLKRLPAALLGQAQHIRVTYVDVVGKRLTDVADKCLAKIDEHSKFSRGSRNKISWKAGKEGINLEDGLTLAEVKPAGLVSSPGAKNEACKEVLNKDYRLFYLIIIL
jgi:hypothetical protein